MGINLLCVCTFLTARHVAGQSATQRSIFPPNVVTGTSAVTEDGPTSSTRLITNIVTGTSAVTEEGPTSSTRLITNIVTGTSAVTEEGPTSSTRLITNIVTGTSAVTEEGPTSSTGLNTNIVTGTSAVTEEGPTSSTGLNTNIVTGASAVTEDDSTSSTRLNTTELGPVTVIDEPTLESLLAHQISEYLMRICMPFLIVAGTFGNVVVIVIHCRLPPNQKSSMSVYFTALAISDTTTLWMGWFEMLDTFGDTLSFEYHLQRDYSDVVKDVLCRIRVWISYAFGQTSAWILVFMTIHRAGHIVWPHRTTRLLTKSNAKKFVVFIVLFCTLSNAHLLYGHSMLVPVDEGSEAFCFFSFVTDSYGKFYNTVWLWEDLVMAVFLPFACLLVTNTVLVRKVGQSLREARDSLAEGRSDPFASRDKKMSSMTLTLIVTSAAFLLLTLPICVHVILEQSQLFDTVHAVENIAANSLAAIASALLWYTNLGINFYLYCLTGARYRAEFVRLLGCRGASTDQTGSLQKQSSNPSHCQTQQSSSL